MDIPIPRQARWDLPADPEAVPKSRQMVRDALTEWKVPDLIEGTELVVSKLATNAIKHGKQPIALSLHASGRCVGGEVSDGGAVFEPPPPPPPDAIGGRGLRLVDAVATRWGIDLAKAGKVVWFRLCQ